MDLILHSNELDVGQNIKKLESWGCKAVVMIEKEILDILQKEKRYLQENFRLLSIGLFGSYFKPYGEKHSLCLKRWCRKCASHF